MKCLYFLSVICLLPFAGKLQNIGMGTNTPMWKLDIRSSHPDDGAQVVSVGNSDHTHFLHLYGGRQLDPNPFIRWKGGDPLRFSTDENGWRELMRITGDGTVGINNFNPHASAILDVHSINKGVLIPRMSTAQRNAIIQPATGLLVFDNNTAGFWFYNGSSWTSLAGAGAGAWSTTGNGGINEATNFIGTTDKRSIIFRVQDQYAGSIDTSNNIMLGNNTPSPGKGFSNVAIGKGALKSNTENSNLVAVGDSALFNNGIGAAQNNHATLNTAVGSKALYANTIGSSNTAIGYGALLSNTSGGGNVAIGSTALTNAKANYNTAVGHGAMGSNLSGHSNTAIGNFALGNNSAGIFNSAFGVNAGANYQSNNYCTFLGSFSNTLSNGLSNATAIGYNAVVAASNTIQLGNPSVSTVNTYGNITVLNGKGLIRSSDGTQRKMVVTPVGISLSIPAGGTTQVAFSFAEVFSSAPEVSIGSCSGGGFAEVVMTLAEVTSTNAKVFIFNPRSFSASPNFTVRVMAIGPQ